MAARTGFLALTGHNIGPLTASHGLINPGSPPFFGPFIPVPPEDADVAGARRPRLLAAERRAPKAQIQSRGLADGQEKRIRTVPKHSVSGHEAPKVLIHKPKKKDE